jgi:integrase
VSKSTARRELIVLSAALRWCWKHGLLDRPIPVTLPPQSEPRERHLTRSEAAQLLCGALGFDSSGKRHPFRINRHLARFILFGLYTGTRHDAILRLQWMPNTTGGWVDLKAEVIYRRPTSAVESGKRRLRPHAAFG